MEEWRKTQHRQGDNLNSRHCTYKTFFLRLSLKMLLDVSETFPEILNLYLEAGIHHWGFSGSTSDKEHTCQCRRHKRCRLGNPLEKGMATHSSILAWRIPWTEEPADYSLEGRKELDMTEVTEHTHIIEPR